VSSPGTVEGDERLRLFCALRLPETTLGELERWQAEHFSAGRLVPRSNLHVTLAFLGSTPAPELGRVVEALQGAAQRTDPIALSPGRYRETSSVGMLVLEDEGGAAERVAERLFGGLEAVGVYKREQRPWLPHVTVVRFRSKPRLEPPLPGLGTFRPSDAAVYMSVLRPSGAQYDVLETVALGG
jgi:RNA 2',3'-cyclic 3'-phosphodiesterase